MNVTMARSYLTGCLILLVEDYKDTRDAIRLFLELCRARVLAAATGQAGLDLVERYQPEVIICDLAMPQMDGYELLERIRELAPGKGGDVPIIALTASADPEERQKALRAGFARFLTKPVDPEKLVHEICRVRGPDRSM